MLSKTLCPEAQKQPFYVFDIEPHGDSALALFVISERLSYKAVEAEK